MGGVAQTLLVTSAFRDPDGDALTYTAASSNEAVATVTVSGAEVSVQPVAVGMATIRVTATDPDGSNMMVTQRFEVSVGDEPLPNQEPQAVGGLPAQMLAVGGGAQTLPVTSAFRDPDGDELTYAVTSSNTRIATARIVSQNAEEGASRATTRSSDTRIAAVQGAEVVEVSPVAGGTVTITVTATDADGSSQTTTQRFTVTVDGPPPPRPPRPPVTGGGSGGGGSGGGGTASRDDHGNSPAQATRITPGATAPWASSTPGQLNTAGDVDYFTFPVPQAGVLVVETTGFTATVGTVWQEGEELVMRRQRGRAAKLSANRAGGSRPGGDCGGGHWQPDRSVHATDAVGRGLSGEPGTGLLSEWGGRAVGLGV